MEFFDVVNKDRKPLNKILPRGCVLKENEFNVGVEVWILNNENNLLITQRSALKSHPLQWECPGGCCLAGEDSIQTAIREIKEEIGLNISNLDLTFLDTHLYKYQFVDIYTAKLNFSISDLTLQESEINDAKIVSFKQFIEMANSQAVVQSVLDRFDIIKNKLCNKYDILI